MASPERNPWVPSPQRALLSSLLPRRRAHIATEGRSAVSASTPRVPSNGVNASTARLCGAFLVDGPARTDRSCATCIRERPDGEPTSRHECVRVRGRFSAASEAVAGRLRGPSRRWSQCFHDGSDGSGGPACPQVRERPIRAAAVPLAALGDTPAFPQDQQRQTRDTAGIPDRRVGGTAASCTFGPDRPRTNAAWPCHAILPRPSD